MPSAPALVALVVLLFSPRASLAQDSTSPATAWELRVTGGAYVPTGGQRHAVDDAHLTAVQLSWLARPSLAVVGTVAWARSRDLVSADAPKLDVFSSDLGVEVRPARLSISGSKTLRLFAGLGVGARSYNHRKLDLPATHNLAGYAAAGSEMGVRRVSLRLEVRDYFTGFRPLVGNGESRARNDVVVMATVGFRRSPRSQNQ